jgi:predicted nucleotidyltransferase
MSQNVERYRHKLREQLPMLADRYAVASLGLFGSHVRGTQRPDSDLDVLVSFREAPGLLRFVELENYLGDVLGVKVDLVMRESLKPHIGINILREVVPI